MRWIGYYGPNIASPPNSHKSRTFNHVRAHHPIDLPKQAGRLAKFAAVGLTATGVYYALLWGMVEFLGAQVLIASSVAFVAVTVENYVLHYVWTFESTGAHFATFSRFLAMNVAGFCINWAVMFLGVSKLGSDYLLVQAVAIVAVIAWNVALSYHWVFLDSHGRTS